MRNSPWASVNPGRCLSRPCAACPGWRRVRLWPVPRGRTLHPASGRRIAGRPISYEDGEAYAGFEAAGDGMGMGWRGESLVLRGVGRRREKPTTVDRPRVLSSRPRLPSSRRGQIGEPLPVRRLRTLRGTSARAASGNRSRRNSTPRDLRFCGRSWRRPVARSAFFMVRGEHDRVSSTAANGGRHPIDNQPKLCGLKHDYGAMG